VFVCESLFRAVPVFENLGTQGSQILLQPLLEVAWKLDCKMSCIETAGYTARHVSYQLVL